MPKSMTFWAFFNILYVVVVKLIRSLPYWFLISAMSFSTASDVGIFFSTQVLFL